MCFVFCFVELGRKCASYFVSLLYIFICILFTNTWKIRHCIRTRYTHTLHVFAEHRYESANASKLTQIYWICCHKPELSFYSFRIWFQGVFMICVFVSVCECFFIGNYVSFESVSNVLSINVYVFSVCVWNSNQTPFHIINTMCRSNIKFIQPNQITFLAIIPSDAFPRPVDVISQSNISNPLH